ncbi:hypothetical protein GGF32_007215 [Allomyces javanicus]|nr:hypothetical protein GGF32_007215 [Allomyces javanicus]
MTIMAHSIERRHRVQLTQLLLRQMVLPDVNLISGDANVKFLRGVLDDLIHLHTNIVTDPTGLSVILLQFTTYLANATSSISNAVSNPTTAGTTMALNPLITSYIDLATQFVDLAAPACLLTSGTIDPVTVTTSKGAITVQLPSPLHPMWVQLQSLSNMVRSQLTTLDTTIGNLVLTQVQDATTACIAVFAAAMVGMIVLGLAVHFVAFRRMRNKARTVVALLFLVPPQVHVELSQLIDSGGNSLQTTYLLHRLQLIGEKADPVSSLNADFGRLTHLVSLTVAGGLTGNIKEANWLSHEFISLTHDQLRQLATLPYLAKLDALVLGARKQSDIVPLEPGVAFPSLVYVQTSSAFFEIVRKATLPALENVTVLFPSRSWFRASVAIPRHVPRLMQLAVVATDMQAPMVEVSLDISDAVRENAPLLTDFNVCVAEKSRQLMCEQFPIKIVV